VVNAAIDACYRSMASGRWEPVELVEWRAGAETPRETRPAAESATGPRGPEGAAFRVIKTERLPDGRTKRILKDASAGRVVEKIE